MNEYAVKITPQANEQVQEIFRYISKTLCVPDTALRLLDELKKAKITCCLHKPGSR